jgi:Cu(I)/Ag(I) efflux system membrane protein CusA/SilA
MVGGMISSTVLTLVVIPVLYALLKDRGVPAGERAPDAPIMAAESRP